MLMPNSIDEIFLAPCGVNCFICYVHLKKKKACHGCYGIDQDKPERCQNCKIKNCCINNKITYCYECKDYPCKLIKNLDKSYRTRYEVEIIQSSEFIKTEGVLEYFENEKNKWKCTKCGGVITQHGRICSECNEVVDS